MKPQIKWAIEACGAALLVSLPYFSPLLYPSRIALYHHHLHLGKLIAGILLAILGVALLVFALIAYIHYRFNSRARAAVGAALAGIVLLRVMDSLVLIVNEWQSSPYSENRGAPRADLFANHLGWFLAHHDLRLAIPFALAGIALWRPRITSLLVRVTRIGLAAFACCLLWIAPQLTYFAFRLRPVPPFDRSTAQASAPTPKRIVWVLFDELSYNLVFDHPPQGMDFPNLRSLRAQSVSFGNLDPVGFATDRIIPSLLTGHEIEAIRSTSNGQLLYRDSGDKALHSLNPNDTLFGLANANGWSPGVDGWYNPDCRILYPVLTSCWWLPGAMARLPAEVMGASEDKSAIANAFQLIPVFLFSPKPSNSEMIGPRGDLLAEQMSHADTLIRDGQIRFVFLHLSVPHPPGFYDRNTHKICACGNYLDNLVLADDTLAALEHEIDSTPWKDQTTLIVSSDHSWRVPLWRGWFGWTPEEETLSGGRFDQRPVFLVHFPGQTSQSDVPAPTPEMTEHDIIAAMLENKLNSPQDLLAFVHAQQAPSRQTAPAPH